MDKILTQTSVKTIRDKKKLARKYSRDFVWIIIHVKWSVKKELHFVKFPCGNIWRVKEAIFHERDFHANKCKTVRGKRS